MEKEKSIGTTYHTSTYNQAWMYDWNPAQSSKTAAEPMSPLVTLMQTADRSRPWSKTKIQNSQLELTSTRNN